MAWMLRVVASLGVIEPFQHQLGRSGWWKKLRLKHGCHGLEQLTHSTTALDVITHPMRACLLCLLLQKQAVVL